MADTTEENPWAPLQAEWAANGYLYGRGEDCPLMCDDGCIYGDDATCGQFCPSKCTPIRCCYGHPECSARVRQPATPLPAQSVNEACP